MRNPFKKYGHTYQGRIDYRIPKIGTWENNPERILSDFARAFKEISSNSPTEFKYIYLK
jgi:hypothetical protein